MMRFAVLIAPVLALAACNLSGEATDESGAEGDTATSQPSPTASPSATPTPADAPAEAVEVSEESALYSFEFAYPKQVAAIPELKSRLDKQMATNKAALASQAREAQADAKDQGFPYNAYAEGTKWQVVTDTPRFLSLSADIYSYTGGAHPNSGTTSLVWDREAKRALKPLDFFTSPQALSAAVETSYCEALNKERAKRRGEPVNKGDTMFGNCPAAGELTVLLGSSNGKTFNRIGFIADPYVAGPYAEGGYDITVPVTDEVMKVVRPAYADAFSRR